MTSNRSVFSSNPIKVTRCLLEQDSLHSLADYLVPGSDSSVIYISNVTCCTIEL